MGLLDIFKQKDSVPEKATTCEKTDSGANMVKEIREEILKKTAIPYMKLQLTDTKPGLFDSKVGGIGYVPHDAKIPEDSKGTQLRLLAQLGCAEITLEDFPHQGLLQFWILNDDVSGLNFDDNTLQDTFRVLYFKEPDQTVTEKEVCEKMAASSDEEDLFPVRGCYGLAFSAGVDTISSGDYRFENCIKRLVRQDYPEEAESLLENIDDFMDEDGNDWGGSHKIGGYPGFTQWDPRGEGDSHNVLLFQLDSDCHNSQDRVLWGDCGIGNFFINRENLKNCDFRDVIYNWDCY